MNLENVKKIFMQRCISIRVTETTLKGYEEFFVRLYRFLGEQQIADFEAIDEIVIRQYLIELSQTMISVTLDGHYRKLNTLFRFLVENEYLSKNPMKLVTRPKVSQRRMKTFGSDEVFKMLHSFDTNDFIGYRNYTILSLLLSTGLRRSEYLNLTLLDVDLNTGLIHVIGKGDKERFVPIGNTLRRILKTYLKKRNEYLVEVCQGHTCPSLFITKQGERMTISASDSIFQEVKKNLKLTGCKFSTHTWRHTFAKTFLLNGGDVFTLQKILGHSDIATTRIYVNLNDNEIKQQNNKYNPLDNSKWQYY